MSATTVYFSLNGVDVTSRVLWNRCTIHDALHSAPNAADLTLRTMPIVGQEIQIGLGDLMPANLLFAGTVQDVGESYLDQFQNKVWPFTAVDWTFTLNKRRPFGTWVNTSATTIAQSLVSTYAPGFTASGVEAALPPVSIIFDGADDFMRCLERLATAIRGYADVDYGRDVKLFLTDVSDAPDPIDAAHPPLNRPPINFRTDLSQIRTRVFGKGHGETTLSEVAAGETVIPLANTVLFNPLGGQALAGTTPDGAQSQILNYTGVQAGGVGSLVGPSAAPLVGPTITPTFGTGIDAGAHSWAVVFGTAAGKSLPSPLTTKTLNADMTAPSAAPTLTTGSDQAGYEGTGIAAGDTVTAYYSYSAAVTPTVFTNDTNHGAASSGLVAVAYPFGGIRAILAAGAYSTDTAVAWVHVWLSVNGGAYFFGTYFANNPAGGTWSDQLAFGWRDTGQPFPTPQPSTRQAAIAGVSLGPVGTTYREVYRTAAGLSQLKLQQTIANNTATVGVTDSTADGSLGADAPTSDTSGLATTTGYVLAGSATLVTANAGAFAAGGGWLVTGDRRIRYTGISGDTLTGIPTSGLGAISATLLYGEHIDAAPALTGVTGLTLAMQRGTKVSLWVERNDTAAQAEMVVREGGDGVVEYLIVDERRGEESLTAVLDADLAKFSRPLVSVTYATHDPLTRSGKTVPISLASGTFDPAVFDPAVFGDVLWAHGDFTIQSVEITFESATINPRYAVTAASTNFRVQDLLRRILLVA